MTPEHLLSLLAIQTVELSAVIAVVWTLSATLFRRRPHLAYALWMVVVVKAVTPPVWSCPTGVFSWALREAPPAAVVQPARVADQFPIPNEFVHATENPMATLSIATLPDSTPIPSAPSHREIHPAEIVLPGIVAGAGVVFACIAISTARLRRRVLRSAIRAGHPAAARIDKIRTPRTPKIVVAAEAIGPALIGALCPLVVIPLHLVERLSDRELRAIIAHELTHRRRGDHWVAAFQRVVISLWWFNPLAWFAHRQINRTRELCCDGQTVAELNCDPADYAQMLLNLLRLQRWTPSSQTLFPGVHAMQITTKRLTALLNRRGDFRRRTPPSAWLLLIATGLALVPGSGLVQTLAADAPATTAPATGESTKRSALPPIIFHGVLANQRNSWPLKGAVVTVRFQSSFGDLNRRTFVHDLGQPAVTTTGADGRFDVVVPGDLAAADPDLEVFVMAYHPDFGTRTLASGWLRGFIGEADWVRKNAPDRTTLPRLDIQWTPADQLTGTLVGPDHRPLAGASVAVMSINLSPRTFLSDEVHTDKDGRFTLPAFVQGETSLIIRPVDAAAFRSRPVGTPDVDGRFDAGTIVAPAGGSVTGSVMDGKGQPLAGWIVGARPMPHANPIAFDDGPVRTATTDAAGRFTLPPMAAGAVQLTVGNPAEIGSQGFPDGMAVPLVYSATEASDGFSPVVVNIAADGPNPEVNFRPAPQVRVVVRAVDPQGKPAAPLATFVEGKVNGVDGAWLALQSGPDTVEAMVPKGITNARVGINDLSADDHRTIARVRRGDRVAVDAGMADLGTVDHDVTDLTVVRYPRPKLTITVTDRDGHALPTALTALRYAKPVLGNPYWDRLTRGSGSAQPLRSYDVFPGQLLTLTTTLDGYIADTRDLTLDWSTDRAVTVRLTPAATTRPAKAQ